MTDGLARSGFGAVDIGVRFYCFAHQSAYSSNFNVFAVLAGAYVRKGHPWWVEWVSRAMTSSAPKGTPEVRAAVQRPRLL
jgi:hypothetical protein